MAETVDCGMGRPLIEAALTIERLRDALKAASPYVESYAENCPDDDGGAEAKVDLELIKSALAEISQE